MRRLALVVFLLVSCAAATSLSAHASGTSAASAWKRCGKIHAAPHGHFRVSKKGHVSCRKAKSLMNQFLNKHKGKKHGGPAGYQTYYTLGHWKCGTGAGGGDCKRKHPRARVSAVYTS
ncbi:MAG: hypothetical protein ACJ766_01240 [Thermoleophilaceae bacterium]